MADLLVRHSLNDNKIIKILVSFRYFVAKSSGGDHIWTLELGTTSLDKEGEKISPIRIHNIDVETIDDVIDEGVALISSQIEWKPFLIDTYPPEVISTIPTGDNVGLGSSVVIELKDKLPASGLDISELGISLDVGDTVFDITNECVITGNPYVYKITWSPKIRVNDTYN